MSGNDTIFEAGLVNVFSSSIKSKLMKQSSGSKINTERSSLRQRLLTSIVLVVVICLALFSGPVGVVLLLLFINSIGALEYRKLIQAAGFSLQQPSLHIAGWLLILIAWLVINHYRSLSILYVLIPLTPCMLIIELFRNQKTPFQNVALTLLGMVWISVPLSLFLCTGFLPIKSGTFHPTLLLGYFTVLWLGDTGAYFTGKFLGKHKLFHRISPNKTWEGSIGGLGFALIAGYGNFVLFHQLSPVKWVVLALIINITGTFGDLIKSMLKRSIGVKDTGTILPGHGGILDRFDSLLGSVPFSFIYLQYYA